MPRLHPRIRTFRGPFWPQFFPTTHFWRRGGARGHGRRLAPAPTGADPKVYEGEGNEDLFVLPVRDGAGRLLAVFDIDSNQPDAFTQEDAAALQGILDKVFHDAA